jgi:glycosyltransferase involved in cell wall biosynthesis
MKILVVADGRSPITRNWVKDLIACGHSVVLVSTFPSDQIAGTDHHYVLPVCFARFAGGQTSDNKGQQKQSVGLIKRIIQRYRGLFQTFRYSLGPLTFPFYRRQLGKIIQDTQPDLVHALRIPFEGMFAFRALPKKMPFVVSIWGNDLTLHAPKSKRMGCLTRQVLKRTDGLIVDVERDVALAHQWGYAQAKPVMVALTSGGIDFERMKQARIQVPDFVELFPEGLWVINPRGIRPGYIRNDTFFAAAALVIETIDMPVYFLCPSMAGQPEAETWVQQFDLQRHVRLLPYLSQEELWYLFSQSAVMVSPSVHDGTPNSLLEAMVMGAFPVVADLDSLREWVNNGKNGLLFDVNSPQALADAILQALSDEDLRNRAALSNYAMVYERASRERIRELRERFYRQILNEERPTP